MASHYVMATEGSIEICEATIYSRIKFQTYAYRLYTTYREEDKPMAKRISIDEHALYHDIVEKLRRALDSGLIKALYVDEQSYTITAISEYGEWSLKLRPPPDPK